MGNRSTAGITHEIAGYPLRFHVLALCEVIATETWKAPKVKERTPKERREDVAKFSIGNRCVQVVALLSAVILWNHTGSAQQTGGGVFSLGISDDATVAFTWRANAEADLAGYKLYVGTVPGVYSGSVDVGRATTYRLNDLLRGMTYYFSLTAYNSSGLESAPTPALTATIPLVLTNLPTPQEVIPSAMTNEPPYFEALPDIVLTEGTTNHSVLLLGIRPGATGEVGAVNITATSSAPELIPPPEVTYTSPEPFGVLTLNAVPGATGTATITATANDGEAQNNIFWRTFSVTVERQNSPPVISRIPDLWLWKDRATEPIPFTLVDAESPPENLEVTITVSNPEVLLASDLTLGGSGPVRTLVIDPRNGRTGVSLVTLTVTDGTSTTSMSFQVTVLSLASFFGNGAQQFLQGEFH